MPIKDRSTIVAANVCRIPYLGCDMEPCGLLGRNSDTTHRNQHQHTAAAQPSLMPQKMTAEGRQPYTAPMPTVTTIRRSEIDQDTLGRNPALAGNPAA